MLPTPIFAGLLAAGVVTFWAGLGVAYGVGAAIAAGVLCERHGRAASRWRGLIEVASAAAALTIAGLVSPAAAVEAVAATPAPPIVEAIRPIVDLVVGAAVTAFLGWLYKRLSEQFGIKVDAERRATLHSSLTTAANLMLARVAATGQASLVEGVIQVWAGAREAIQHFGLKDEAIEKMLKAKLQESDVTLLSEPTPGGSAIVARRSYPGRSD